MASGLPLRAVEIGRNGPGHLITIQAQLASGQLYEAERTASLACREYLASSHEQIFAAVYYSYVGLVQMNRGLDASEVFAACRSVRENYPDWRDYYLEVHTLAVHEAEWCLSRGDTEGCRICADLAWETMDWFHSQHDIANPLGDFARVAYLFGRSYLDDGDFDQAKKCLDDALRQARTGAMVVEELLSLTALADLHLRQGYPDTARDYLADIWEPAYRGPYPLLHADALTVLVEIERLAGNTEATSDAARQAYALAWCEGPPWAYMEHLTKLRKVLDALGCAVSDLPSSMTINSEATVPELSFSTD